MAMPGTVLIGFAGALPADAHPHAKTAFCYSFKKHSVCNGCPSYVNADANWMLWSIKAYGRRSWIVGKAGFMGQRVGFMTVQDDAQVAEQITGTWAVLTTREKTTRSTAQWAAAPRLKLLHNSQVGSDDVTVTRVRTREERDADGRAHALDLNLFDVKRPRTAPCELETRVTTARSVCTAAVDKRVIELMQPAMAQYVKNEIDAAELDRRKAATRATAEAEHPPLSRLDKCYTAYTEALAARIKVEDAVERAMVTEDAAKAELEAVVRALLPQQAQAEEAGPSGVVKSE